MTDHQCRAIIDKLQDLCRFVQEASDHEREATVLTAVLSTALLGVLEFAEANHPSVVSAEDWSTVKMFLRLTY